MRLSVVRLPVVLLGVVAVIGVAGILVWGGGDEPQYASAGGTGSGAASDPGFATPGAASDSPSAAGGTTTPLPPFNPADLAPTGGSQVTPTETRAILAWRVEGRSWSSLLGAYQSYFAAEGYRLGEQRITTTDGDTGAPKGGAWDIEPAQTDASGYAPDTGLLYIGPAPDDPTDTLVEVEIY